jgi:hypothetical protein
MLSYISHSSKSGRSSSKGESIEGRTSAGKGGDEEPESHRRSSSSCGRRKRVSVAGKAATTERA